MAYRIGGTTGSLPTWGRLRSPLVLNNQYSGNSYTRFSRRYPSTTEDPFPRFFIWKSGSPFRCIAWFGPGTYWNQPYYWIQGYKGDPEGDPPIPDTTEFGMGKFIYGPPDQIDKQDFMELIGEDVETDGGIFTITEDAHDWEEPVRAWQTITNLYATEIYKIGKLTPV